jgi:hypothetical protein
MTAFVYESKVRCLKNQKLLADTRFRIACSRRQLNPAWAIAGASDDKHPQLARARTLDGPDPATAESRAKNLGWLVWDKMERGRLFLLPDAQCWVGPVTGQQCVVCEQGIQGGSECEVTGLDGPVFAHLACHKAWSRESHVRRQRSRFTAAS